MARAITHWRTLCNTVVLMILITNVPESTAATPNITSNHSVSETQQLKQRTLGSNNNKNINSNNNIDNTKKNNIINNININNTSTNNNKISNNNNNNYYNAVSSSTETVSPASLEIESHFSDANDALLANSEYGKLDQLHKNLLKAGRYNTKLRPVYNQTRPTVVELRIEINDLVSLDDVDQTMVTDCYIVEMWSDELLTWNKTDYDFDMVSMSVDDVWTPGLSLYNSMNKKDILGDANKVPLAVFASGKVQWGFQEYLTTSCLMDMDKYPFDEQTCHIKLSSAANYKREVEIYIEEKGAMKTYSQNHGWRIVETEAAVSKDLTIHNVPFAFARFTVKLRRRPTLILINDILPTVALSFLNSFVFFVPVDSGEKISFGNSVVLALAVFISTTSARLPSATEGIPAVTKYLGFLFINSIAAVLLAILNVRLHHYVERQTNKEDCLSHPPPTNTSHNKILSPPSNNKDKDDGDERKESSTTKVKDGHCVLTPNPNPTYGCSSLALLVTISKYAEILDFFIILGCWVTATGWFIHHIMR